MTIKAIETRYAGCHFRSRLEARWAVFFDHLGMPWEYEPQGYETSAGRYLPDFNLPEQGLYVEVKGNDSQLDIDTPKMRAFVDEAELNLLLLGTIVDSRTLQHRCLWWPVLAGAGTFDGASLGFHDLHLRTVAQNLAGKWMFHLPMPAGPKQLTTQPLGFRGLLHSPAVVAAFAAARSARFEHGQAG